MKTVLLFRHGEVEDCYRDRVRGSKTDCLLSAEGERMSIANTQFMVREGVELVITSGMKRTDYVGTLANAHGIHYQADPRLREMDMGVWEGRLLQEVNDAHPEEAKAFMADPLSGVFPGLEDVDVYRDRVTSAWEEILQLPADRIAIVAHGITNTVILRHIRQSACALRQTIGCMNEIAIHPPATVVRENVVLY